MPACVRCKRQKISIYYEIADFEGAHLDAAKDFKKPKSFIERQTLFSYHGGDRHCLKMKQATGSRRATSF
jgi:hypothetical protein